MNFRTIITTGPPRNVISYRDHIMLIGSCFAAYMGEHMKMCKMPVMINPSGTVYNPVSVFNTIDSIISSKVISVNDLFYHNKTWLSFFHYTDFTSDDPEQLIKKINDINFRAGEVLKKAGFLFITFGTSRVYRHKESGLIVSNCHKVPNSGFDNELLTVREIADQWISLLDRLYAFNPGLRVVFTVSPVRHWKDGAHGNQVSKSVLFLAIEELLGHKSEPEYFPAYELQMDDLRDYRFYADDMLHPSQSAIEYIWGKFSDAYFDKSTRELQSQILKITKAINHRIITESDSAKKAFAGSMLNLITELERRNADIDFCREKEYFRKLTLP
ncbi:MAG: GSCFA domain-containing protein [Bacteroidia bacterium]|nr:GSCFA domain-containing protein [Bacteroidia bacterium]